ncbi:MAG TPA: DNA mismatch repair endonuclease MutL [Gemmatales bacterium]|nr:DNA mismatch repair endonuclease MutL [Gemmatales bacterium]
MPGSASPSSSPSRSAGPPRAPGRIQVLPPHVVNQIAAGEVIERPASVLKELLDNAVDAGATRIVVDAAGGGLDLLRVADDGRGIDPDDLPLAFASHATSKLRQPEDLFSIRTMGFRGEALASIGSVARVLLQSRPRGAELGAQIECAGGTLGTVRPWAGQEGTRVEVRELFFNTPARRRFMRTPATEMGHLSEIVTRFALGCPHLGFTLTHNDRSVYEVPASADLAERIRLFFGREIADKLLPVAGGQGPVKVTGLIADPSVDRGNARYQYLFVNGRWIRDRTLGHALHEGYHGLLMVGRYAIAFLFLELPPDLVDVNVHPTKAEVRFRDGQALHHLVRSAVRQALQHVQPAVPAVFGAGRGSSHAVAPLMLQPVAPTPHRLFDSPRPLDPLPPTAPAAGPVAADPPTPAASPPSGPTMPSALPGPSAVASAPASSAGSPTDLPSAENSPPSDLANLPSKAFQLHHAYLVVEIEEGMLVIDQHALHERILYEQFKARVRAGSVEAQRLLIPEPVDLAPEQAGLILEHAADLERLGIGVQDFGGGTILVTSQPTALRRLLPADLLRQVAEHLQASARPPTAEQLRDDLLRMMACKAAVKAGDPLGPDEIAALLAHRGLVADTHHCPHGRPTSLLLSKKELDRQFQRI